jgi:hypothetical protein
MTAGRPTEPPVAPSSQPPSSSTDHPSPPAPPYGYAPPYGSPAAPDPRAEPYPRTAPYPGQDATLPRMPSPSLAGALRAVGLVLVLGLLGMGAAEVVVEFFRQQAVETVPLAAGVTRMVAATDTGDVRVRAAAMGEQPRMIRTLRWSFSRPRLQQQVSGGSEQVDARCPVHRFGTCSVDLELVVPPATTLRVDTDTGDVFVNGTSGDLAATTSTGGVTMTGVSGRNLSARTNTGDVRVAASGANAVVAASSDTGDVQLSFAAAPQSVRASTSTGDVTISVPAGDSYAVTAQTDVGDRRIQVPSDPAAARSLFATSSVGDVQVLTFGQ